MSKPTLARIVVTMGDAAGIGPEVIVKALGDPEVAGLAQWIIVGEEAILAQAAEKIDPTFCPQVIDDPSKISDQKNVLLLSLRQLESYRVVPGRLSAECGRAALEYIRSATQLCLQGQAAAMVTAPVNKEAVVLSGVAFSGHTEFIAELCGTNESRLMLTNPQLSVVHVSTHRSLRQACELDEAQILLTIQLGHQALRLLGCDHPRIAVCGLNPHASEHGLFGDEEARLIAPAIRAAQRLEIDCHGPFPADTLFLKATQGAFPMVVAMYHDQGHVPMKLLAFEDTVNVTLGLPIVRTSVDHGTAFDIAGRNQADSTNMKAAMTLAVDMAKTTDRKRNPELWNVVS